MNQLIVRTVAVDETEPLIPRTDPRNPLVWLRRGEGVVGLGEVLRIETSGARRIEDAAAAWTSLAEAADVDDRVGLPGTGLVAFGAFAFAARSAATSVLIVPELILGRRDGRAWVTRVALADSADGRALRTTDAAWAPGTGATAGVTQVDATTGSIQIVLPTPVPKRQVPRVSFEPGSMSPAAYEEAVAEAVRRIDAADPEPSRAAHTEPAERADADRADQGDHSHHGDRADQGDHTHHGDRGDRSAEPDDHTHTHTHTHHGHGHGHDRGEKPRRLEKVVLARQLVGELHEDAGLRATINRLAEDYPDTWVFAVDGLIGASPETLVRVDHGTVSARVLAGTAPRGAGEASDRDHAAGLAASEKNLAEHSLAVASAVQRLAPHTRRLDASPEPFTLQLPNLWHLATDLKGTLGDGSSSLDLVRAVHPTAAVAGTPRRVALDAIAELEGFDRGRYAGPVGWIDGDGDGEWAIALRCAQVDADGTVTAYAGCGIVHDSVPADELAETEMKFRPIVEAFGG